MRMPDMEGVLRRADGARIAYRAAGAGPPVAAVHGIGSTARSFTPLAAHLARRHRMLAVDLRGYGDSGDHPVAIGWRTFADDVAALLDHAGDHGRTHLMAASAGTLTALTLCDDYPDRVASLTLVGPTLGDAADPATARRLLSQRLSALGRVRSGAAARAARMVGPDADESAVRLLRSQHARIRPAGYGTVARLLARTDAADLVARVAVPVQVLVGEHDAVTGPPVAERVVGLLPSAEVVTLPRVGHCPHVEQPQRTAELVAAFTAAVERR